MSIKKKKILQNLWNQIYQFYGKKSNIFDKIKLYLLLLEKGKYQKKICEIDLFFISQWPGLWKLSGWLCNNSYIPRKYGNGWSQYNHQPIITGSNSLVNYIERIVEIKTGNANSIIEEKIAIEKQHWENNRNQMVHGLKNKIKFLLQI